MFHLQDVSKTFGLTTALHRLTIEFAPQQTTVLIGPSGCGKSTMLRLMMGLLRPDTGTIYFDRAPLEPRNIDRLRHRIGYVIQEGGLFPHLTARENVILAAEYLRWPQQRIARRASELAELVHLPDETLARYPSQLSGGQRQRVSLMRALMLDPAALLLDEPLGALDPMIRAELRTDLRQIFRTLRKTVILVTHDLHEAAFFADAILLLRGGRLVQQGTIAELADSPAEEFVSQFISAQRATFVGGAA
jgi:osmoprotectant transport system ATP-binding protein